jgi:DNA modification methylase
VFKVTTKPFADAHFAVYPRELCEKPIKATCPPKVCAECGNPYEREIERTSISTEDLREKFPERFEDTERVGAQERNDQTRRKISGQEMNELKKKHPDKFKGWEQTCNCETDETEAGIVLDPFSGAGTTALVAKDLGRRFVGIELNPEYVAMSQKRVGITVDEPERLLSDDETSLEAFADGGNYGD